MFHQLGSPVGESSKHIEHQMSNTTQFFKNYIQNVNI